MRTDLDTIFLHQTPMRLIHTIAACDTDAITCQVVIRADSIFYDSTIDGIYAWVGIEYMAQAVAAFAGLHKEQVQPALGLLLSVRTFQTQYYYFKVGQLLEVRAHKEYIFEGVGVFNCDITIEGKVIASAKLSTIEPPHDKIESILQGQKL